MKVEIDGNSSRIMPYESVDLTNAEEMEAKFLELVEKKEITNLIIDFEQVKKIDSHGLGKLLLFNKIIKENKGMFKLENVNSEYVIKVFKMLDLEEVMNIDISN